MYVFHNDRRRRPADHNKRYEPASLTDKLSESEYPKGITIEPPLSSTLSLLSRKLSKSLNYWWIKMQIKLQ